jgi:uncharacterized protein YndB with AHSA1/START domain
MGTNVRTITVETMIEAPIDRVWEMWTEPEHIVNWNFASDDWYCPTAKNDIRPGGEFNWRMEARDGSTGFDFMGTYDEIDLYRRIKSTLGDGRKTEITFSSMEDSTQIIETFEAEDMNTLELQQTGWQAILNNFRKYAESIR